MKVFKTAKDIENTLLKAKKKPVVIECCKVNEPFEIHTLEGVLKGKSGDWIIVGVEGEIYACDDGIFKKTYQLIDQDEE